MRVRCTFPGRAGDLLWALPTVRAISEHIAAPVDLLIAGEFAPLIPLLVQQPYLARVVADPAWTMAQDWQPPSPVDRTHYDEVVHLGYRRWPELPLPLETARMAGHIAPEGIDLVRPWIQVDGPGVPCGIAVGFTEAWFELKLGLLAAVERRLPSSLLQLTPPGSRWTTEAVGTTSVWACSWLEAARAIRNCDLFLGDCSALHVLAVALGKPCVIVEPMEQRLNPIFWPLGTHDRVRLVRGNDGLATFDSRHCADTLQEVLRAQIHPRA